MLRYGPGINNNGGFGFGANRIVGYGMPIKIDVGFYLHMRV
jgi:hypothetical protein